ncbi:MAG: speA [Parachlamydiales bacterium]|nr:speA [Parachlamydiales bacterium]
MFWIHGWGENYFDINEKGHIIVRPDRNGPTFDLYEMVQSLVQRGIDPPILFRFDGIIKDRIQRLCASFDGAIREFNYQNHYRPAFPIKVNQQKHVVDVIRNAGKDFLLGLEVGSKPELVGVLSIHNTDGALLLCNGYKDAEYIELALLSRKIGRRSIIIVEQFYELNLVLEIASKLGIDAEIGFRMKPSSKGSGIWATSGGDMAKFGLNIHEIIMGVEILKKAGKDHWLKLLHFHIGSQITSIVSIKKALREATRMYTELAKLCPSMSFFDTGGGLGVDYDGTRTSSDSSMNYSMEEYARDIVYAVGSACDEAHIPHPVIVSESGRAIVAHSSVLVTEVIDVAPILGPVGEMGPPPGNHELLGEMLNLYQTVTPKTCHEVLNDAYDLRHNILEQFIQGNISLAERGYAESAFRHLLARIRQLSKELKYVPSDIEKLDEKLLKMYFCNFSVFQSLPDSWAIKQLFPVMPIHRLNEEPKVRATIVDLTCDSDGKIDRFVHPKESAKYIHLHELDKTPYYLGIFLVGAYQETLGGLHNLFGDTNAVHIDMDEAGNWVFKHEIEGNSMSEVLRYVQYDSADLIERLRLSIEKALKEGRLTNEESAQLKKRFKEALEHYTYLVV